MWDLWGIKRHWGRFLFSEYFCFPCQFSFHRLLYIHHHHHPSSGAGTIDQIKVELPSGFSLTPPQKLKKETENVGGLYVG
jgi:hypothetical protein